MDAREWLNLGSRLEAFVDTCDVLIVGGGPAGSSCARRLGQAGLDVIVMDRAAFPRDKVCAGWVTPQVFTDLDLDPQQYASNRTLQPIRNFRVGQVGRGRVVTVRYDDVVSFAIRRCEFDHFLLQRANARLILGEGVTSLIRDKRGWTINESVRASMLVGAGGQHCPVARTIQDGSGRATVVAAQEVELPLGDARVGPGMDGDTVALYFSPDLMGYGWCLRKQDYLNVGFGRYGGSDVRQRVIEFAAFLADNDIVHPDPSWHWHGHSYRVVSDRRRRIVDDGVLLIGDAAGLACPASGEGIRPAIESGLLAARAIVEARGHYTRAALEPYVRQVDQRFGALSRGSRAFTTGMQRLIAPLLASHWLVRHVVLDRWFLHTTLPALTVAEFG